jgi:membrane-associated phospholipid phosphatase
MERTDKLISTVLNPFFLSPVLFIMIAFRNAGSHAETGVIAAIAIGFQTLIPLLILYVLKRRNLIANFDVPRRTNRNRPFVFGLLSVAAALLVYYMLPWPWTMVLALLALAGLVNGVISGLINLKWKISIHTNGMASFGTGLLYLTAFGYLEPLPGYPWVVVGVLFMLTLLVIRARIRLRMHTPAQAFAGAVAGIALTWVQLILYLPGL